MLDCGLDMADLQDYSVPEPTVHQAIGACHCFSPEILEIALFDNIAECWVVHNAREWGRHRQRG